MGIDVYTLSYPKINFNFSSKDNENYNKIFGKLFKL